MLINKLEIILYYVIPSLILSIGLIGNISGLIVFKDKKKIEAIGPVLMYRMMFIFDTVFLTGILVPFFSTTYFQFTFYLMSDLSCKLFMYYGYISKNIAPAILVYISLDRFISIKYFSRRFLLKNNLFQSLFILSFVLFNFLYYTPVFFYFKLTDDGPANVSECYLNGENSANVFYMDTSFLICLFSTMLIITFMLIYTVFASRSRINSHYTQRQNHNFRKDLKLTITTVFFNILYVFLYSPKTIFINFFPYVDDIVYFLALYLYFLSLSSNFYILLVSNLVFRKRFFLLFIKKDTAIAFKERHLLVPKKKINLYKFFSFLYFLQSYNKK